MLGFYDDAELKQAEKEFISNQYDFSNYSRWIDKKERDNGAGKTCTPIPKKFSRYEAAKNRDSESDNIDEVFCTPYKIVHNTGRGVQERKLWWNTEYCASWRCIDKTTFNIHTSRPL